MSIKCIICDCMYGTVDASEYRYADVDVCVCVCVVCVVGVHVCVWGRISECICHCE